MKIKLFRTLHRRMGIVVSVLAIWLALSGIALNHSERMRLAERSIGPSLAELFYGLQIGQLEQGYKVGQSWLAVAEQQLYFNGQRIAGGYNALQGAVLFNQDEFPMVLAADNQSVTALTDSGELIERIYVADLPLDDIRAISLLSGLPAVYSESGRCFRANSSELLQWRSCETPAVFNPDATVVSQPGPLPEPVTTAIRAQLGGASISWQQLLLDLHSGKAVGVLGRAIVDVSGVLLLLLSLTGLWVATHRRRRSR